MCWRSRRNGWTSSVRCASASAARSPWSAGAVADDRIIVHDPVNSTTSPVDMDLPCRCCSANRRR